MREGQTEREMVKKGCEGRREQDERIGMEEGDERDREGEREGRRKEKRKKVEADTYQENIRNSIR